MQKDFYIEVNSQQRNHDEERICGDVFLNRYIKEEDRVVAVLSDGMGHGVNCLLYTSDAADDLLCVDLGGRRIIKKKK